MSDLFSRIARGTANGVAHPATFVGAVVLVLMWAACGPAVHYSTDWQLVINTGTTILTFLIVFLLQNTQNRDSRAMHIKLDELLRAVHGARTELVDLENLTEGELARYCKEFQDLHLRYARVLAKRGHKVALDVDAAELELEKPSPVPRRKGRHG
jgi:low affinity Fe/Cu permease